MYEYRYRRNFEEYGGFALVIKFFFSPFCSGDKKKRNDVGLVLRKRAARQRRFDYRGRNGRKYEQNRNDLLVFDIDIDIDVHSTKQHFDEEYGRRQ